eukprot:TRINITY_DN8574_c0_g1_i1.p1 TRINITY_DN8574_c0_g1~~TRINITY_DN8574_c0_g1_i1.p1  ORF type:complete len:143 (+),score=38.69 TRINITY_DN8574_c0_g1_i1:28-456(+)
MNREQENEHEFLDALLNNAGAGVNVNDDIFLVAQMILQEKSSPNLLPYQENIVNELSEIIKHQEQVIQKQTENKFLHNIYELDLLRTKYMLKSYLRLRLGKVQKFYLYFMQHEPRQSLLSANERDFLKKFYQLRWSGSTQNS